MPEQLHVTVQSKSHFQRNYSPSSQCLLFLMFNLCCWTPTSCTTARCVTLF